MEQGPLTEAETKAHNEITRCLEQAEVRLLHDNPTPDEKEEARTYIIKAFSLLRIEHNIIKRKYRG